MKIALKVLVALLVAGAVFLAYAIYSTDRMLKNGHKGFDFERFATDPRITKEYDAAVPAPKPADAAGPSSPVGTAP